MNIFWGVKKLWIYIYTYIYFFWGGGGQNTIVLFGGSFIYSLGLFKVWLPNGIFLGP